MCSDWKTRPANAQARLEQYEREMARQQATTGQQARLAKPRQAVELRLQELAALQALMVAPPGGGLDQRVRHRPGQTP